jgi:hypothetical protein
MDDDWKDGVELSLSQYLLTEPTIETHTQSEVTFPLFGPSQEKSIEWDQAIPVFRMHAGDLPL